MTTPIVIEDDWSIVNEQIESMTIDDIYASQNEEWEFCEHHDDDGMVISSSSSIEDQSSSLDSVPIPIVGGYVRVSYKEMLLKKRMSDESIATSSCEKEIVAPRVPWKPRIEVMTNTPWKRVDREYGPSSSQLGGYYDEYDGMKISSANIFRYSYLSSTCAHLMLFSSFVQNGAWRTSYQQN